MCNDMNGDTIAETVTSREAMVNNTSDQDEARDETPTALSTALTASPGDTHPTLRQRHSLSSNNQCDNASVISTTFSTTAQAGTTSTVTPSSSAFSSTSAVQSNSSGRSSIHHVEVQPTPGQQYPETPMQPQSQPSSQPLLQTQRQPQSQLQSQSQLQPQPQPQLRPQPQNSTNSQPQAHHHRHRRQQPQVTARDRLILTCVRLGLLSAAVGGAYLLKDSEAMIPFAIAACIATISSVLFRYALVSMYGVGATGRGRGRVRHLRHHRHLSGERAEYVRASQRLAMMDRDFTAADYEILLDLDTYSQRFRRFLDGASEEEIARLPVFEYKTKKKMSPDAQNDDGKNDSGKNDDVDGDTVTVDEENESQSDANAKDKDKDNDIDNGNDSEKDEFSSLAGATANKCMICLEDFDDGMMIRTLPCFHRFMAECIDHWLLQQAKCPVCKKSIREEMNILPS